MSRSLKKGPFIDPKLEAKIVAQAEGNKKSVIKTWSRASMISPDFVGQTIAVHNGNKFIPVYVTENMVVVKRRSGEVDVIPFYKSGKVWRVDQENTVTIGYGNNTVEEVVAEGNVTVTTF